MGKHNEEGINMGKHNEEGINMGKHNEEGINMGKHKPRKTKSSDASRNATIKEMANSKKKS